MKLAGLDIGTTTISVLALDARTGEVAAVATEPNAATLPPEGPSQALQDPGAILAIAVRMLDRVLDAHPDVRGVGVTGQMHGILYVDAGGGATSPLYTWQDGRGDLLRPDGTSHAAHLSRLLGQPLATGMGVVTHSCNALEGRVPARAAAFCTIGDYVAMHLAGARAPVIDATNAASLGGFDARRSAFRLDALKGAGIDIGLFPRVATGYPALGEVRPRVPVFPAIGDNQASFAGSVRELRGAALVNVGTGSQLSVWTENPCESPGIDARPFPFGGFPGVGAGLCGGRAYALLAGFFERTIRLFTGAAGTVSWDAMNAIDESALSGGRVLVDTRFSGTRADPALRGSIDNLGVDTFTPEHLIVGVRDGIAAELHGFFEKLPGGTRRSVVRLVGSGNAIRLNPALRAAFERRFGLPMAVPQHHEEACYGAALVAGVAGGTFADLAAAGALIRYRDQPAGP